jgi:membrane-associated phospholipid phosphatase
MLVVALGFQGRSERIYALCLSVAAGAAISIGFWTLAPSFGAFSVYELPAAVSRHLALALDGHYAHELVHLLASGPGRISPSEAQGLIGFPSYHAVLALLVVWYARELPVIRWIALGINAVVLVATPIQGGHHVVDVLAGFPVAAVTIALTGYAVRVAARAQGRVALKTQPANL